LFSGLRRSITGLALEAVKQAGVAIEVSTAGLRKPCREIYPSEEFLRLAHNSMCPFTLGSDAHIPQDTGADFNKVVALARRCGYDKIVDSRQCHRELGPSDELLPGTPAFLPRSKIEDVPRAVRAELCLPLPAGTRIAIAVGSRGIATLPVIVNEVSSGCANTAPSRSFVRGDGQSRRRNGGRSAEDSEDFDELRLCLRWNSATRAGRVHRPGGISVRRHHPDQSRQGTHVVFMAGMRAG